TWRKRAREVAEFQEIYGRLPKNYGDQNERSLYNWLMRQRRLLRDGLLHNSKIVLLSELRGWEKSPSAEQTQVWLDRLDGVCEFMADTGRLPRYKNFSSEDERVLGVWLHNQHQRRAAGTILPWRLEE